MCEGSTPIKPNRRNRLGVLRVLPLLLFGLLAADFGPRLVAQAQTQQELDEVRRRQIQLQRELAKQRALLANPNRDVSRSCGRFQSRFPRIARSCWLKPTKRLSQCL